MNTAATPSRRTPWLLAWLSRWPMRIWLPVLMLCLVLGIRAVISYQSWQATQSTIRADAEVKLNDRLHLEQTRLEVQLGRDMASGSRLGVRRLVSSWGLYPGIAHVWLVDSQSQVVASLSRRDIGRALDQIPAAQPFSESPAARTAAWDSPVPHVMGQLQVYPGHRLLVQVDVSAPLAQAWTQARTRLQRELLLVLLAVVVSGVLMHLLWVRRVERIESTALALGQGDWQARSGLSGTDELGRIGQALDHMAARMQQHHQHLHAVANASPVLLWTSGLDRGCDWFNQRWLDFTGRTMAQELGNGWAQGVHPDDMDRCLSVYTAAFDARQPFSMEYRLRRHDGEYRWVLDQGMPRLDAQGSFVGFIGSCLDVTAQVQAEEHLQQVNAALEQRVAERTGALQALNQSLESFVYSVSHDLKAPLRGVAGYSRLLEHDHLAQLDDEGRWFVGQILSGVHRMEQLIDDLLAYSRMERRHLELRPLSLASQIHGVLDWSEPALQARHCELVTRLCETQVQADATGLELVLRNLLDNAIKFSATAAPPRIEVGCMVCDGVARVWIRDNGVGFDMKYHDRIFEMFQRLHRQEDFAGTGIGLALVKKAMERMHGRVWAESQPEAGATFWLELPLA